MKVKLFLLLSVLLLISYLSLRESEYEKLMRPVKTIKQAEKKQKKMAPVFEGVLEPEFPDENENNKTFNGVDSNGDGVRDDIEIWINRTARDEYIRMAMKDYSKKKLALMKAVYEKQSEEKIKSAEADTVDSAFCLRVVLIPYEKEFKKNLNGDIFEMKEYKLTLLFANNPERKSAESMYNHLQINSDFNKNESCENALLKKRVKEILNSN